MNFDNFIQSESMKHSCFIRENIHNEEILIEYFKKLVKERSFIDLYSDHFMLLLNKLDFDEYQIEKYFEEDSLIHCLTCCDNPNNVKQTINFIKKKFPRYKINNVFNCYCLKYLENHELMSLYYDEKFVDFKEEIKSKLYDIS